MVVQAYFSSASELHSKQMKALLLAYVGTIKKAVEEEDEGTSKRIPIHISGSLMITTLDFGLAPPTSISRATTMRKAAGALMGNETKKEKEKEKPGQEGEMRAMDVSRLPKPDFLLHRQDSIGFPKSHGRNYTTDLSGRRVHCRLPPDQ